jgi:2-desacetyl-2-hydroxyethyl bacteriochlorophyllide A dehydrogenase
VNRHAVIFRGPRAVEVCEEALPEPGPGEVRVQAEASLISAGTEMLFYRGQVPDDLPVDATIAGMGERFTYPLKYGYALVGHVEALGEGIDAGWQDRQVFAFHPHESAFCARPEELIALPMGVETEAATFLPGAETAVTLLLDGAPLLGERAVVFGQGIVGLLVTRLLGRMPLDRLVTVDGYPLRRAASLAAGADRCLPPGDVNTLRKHLWGEGAAQGADLAYELSGSPEALDAAVAATGYSGRVVVGSWYGTKPAALHLGGRFHRSRIRVISSQVSSIAPALRGRWDRERRFAAAWSLIRTLDAGALITHRYPIERAAEAYDLLDQHPEQALGVLLTYGTT